MDNQKNVFGDELIECSCRPMTGFYRNGACHSDQRDVGLHTVCVQVTRKFLEYSKNKGNDLSTPVPEFEFPGLTDGDRWCLCAQRWKEAYDDGVAPRVILQATHVKTLEIIPIDVLKSFAIDLS